MRTLRITLAACVAGWVAGVVAGSVGGLAMVLLRGSAAAASGWFMVPRMLASEVRWASTVAVAILPCSLFLVAPLVFRALGAASVWHPFKAACAGAALGPAGLAGWWLVLSLFNTRFGQRVFLWLFANPLDWRRRGDDLFVAEFLLPVALVIGATVGGVAAAMCRAQAWSAPAVATAPAAPDVPPPLPYEY